MSIRVAYGNYKRSGRRPYQAETMASRVLQAAYQKWMEGHGEITQEDLIVRAWNNWPSQFGMKDHDLPDTNRVITYIVGRRGLVAAGMLARVGKGRLAITQAGIETARAAEAGGR